MPSKFISSLQDHYRIIHSSQSFSCVGTLKLQRCKVAEKGKENAEQAHLSIVVVTRGLEGGGKVGGGNVGEVICVKFSQ